MALSFVKKGNFSARNYNTHRIMEKVNLEIESVTEINKTFLICVLLRMLFFVFFFAYSKTVTNIIQSLS